MHGKGEFSKIKASIYIIFIEAANIFNILPRPAVSNELIAVKLKGDLINAGVMNILNQFTQTLCTKRSLILNLIMNPMLIFLFQRISQVRKCSDVKKMVLLLKKKFLMVQKSVKV